jgi:hypothetical protein
MRARRTLWRRTGALLVLVAATSCTGGHSEGAAPTTRATIPAKTTTAPAVTLVRPNARFVVSVPQLGDGVHRGERRALRRAVGAPVSAWFDKAFLRVHYPASSFPGAFAAWTPGTVAQARRDSDVTTNAKLGHDLVALVADKRQATVYVFARRGVVGGATAQVRLAMTGEKKNGSLVRAVVWGDVYLTRDKARWSIFGYDLHRSVAGS